MTSGVDKAHYLDDMARVAELAQIGNALVIAPHPDDESLGCGGTIALLRQRGYSIHVLFVSDGTMSHPNSPAYPAERLRKVREAEALDALKCLGVPAENAIFMRQKDTQVATPEQADFAKLVDFIHDLLLTLSPTSVLVPWRRDPHRDHRACWQLVNAALSKLSVKPRLLEYLIWLWELGKEQDMPKQDEMLVWSVPIESVMKQRDQAIAAHRSQVSRMIDDDPSAFYLSPELLTHFDTPRELFLEELVNEHNHA
ncbi:PIG-L deacetylase family protein [Spirosoma pollinicola]|uniref:PIG-L family deacetylase n=1 Tax=Spirosoma pollinicola TaxID=2057025 RepID=A0A2K8Z514_9BACT|nr:PIG-L deacetylase family protein [Spirosoma pollinicola]AUD04950.1 PIG-L family deacetylase [Spirosoma pollinicola]